MGKSVFEKSEVAEASLRTIRRLQPLMAGIRRSDRALANQLMRAMTNVALCIGRAEYREVSARRGHLLEAIGSAGEVQAVLQLAIFSRYCTPERAKRAREELSRTTALLWKMASRKRSRAA